MEELTCSGTFRGTVQDFNGYTTKQTFHCYFVKICEPYFCRRSSCGFARSEPMVCCSSQSIVKEEEKVEERVVVQRLGGESFSGRVDNTIASSGRPISTSSGRPTSSSSGRPNSRASGRPAGRPGDNGSSAVRFGGSSTSDEVTTVETGRRVGEEEFSRRNGFGPEVLEEEDESGEDWGAVSSTEEEELGGDDEEWRGGDDGGEIWDLGGQEDFESYEGEDWGVQSLGTKCVTAFDCV